MTNKLFAGAFILGAMAVIWVGAGFVGTNHLALVMTAAIGAVYAVGGLEVLRFRQATQTLAAALEAIPGELSSLDAWLGSVHPSLQTPVRLRIEGERIALPGPALTPYLVGLLVMLGMLGTFLGMVVTLNGAVFALGGTTDLAAIRSALAAPIKGLGLAFGTSVAGVTASAMLGLMSALSRRERMQAAQLLDTRSATTLRSFSLAHQRQEAYQAMQAQARALPEVVTALNAMMAQMERSSQQINERLLGNQQGFQDELKGIYTGLALAVDKSLRDSLSQSAHAAGASIAPVVEAAMTGIAGEAKVMHERMVETTQAQLDALATSFEQRSQALVAAVDSGYAKAQAGQATADQQRLDAWTRSLEAMAAGLHHGWQEAGAQTLARQQDICTTLEKTAQAIAAQTQASASTTLGEIAGLATTTEELLRSRIAAEAEWTRQHGERMDQLVGLLRSELGALRDEEARRGQAAVERLGDLQTALGQHLTTLGAALEEPLARLMAGAAEAPRAAAELITQLRQEISRGMARDNELLEERGRIMETLSTLLDAINHASAEQRTTIDSLVASSAVALNQAGSQFAGQIGTETARLAEIAAHVSGSAVEVSSLSESFGFAVQSFSAANATLIDNLQRIEAAMDKSMARSDEQLAYYVSQAREVIDLSIMSQKEIFDELRRLPTRQTMLAEEAN